MPEKNMKFPRTQFLYKVLDMLRFMLIRDI